jgi:hypothetical protein
MQSDQESVGGQSRNKEYVLDWLLVIVRGLDVKSLKGSGCRFADLLIMQADVGDVMMRKDAISQSTYSFYPRITNISMMQWCWMKLETSQQLEILRCVAAQPT